MASAGRRREDLAGRVFGRLTVISFDHSKKAGNSTRSYWRCSCTCGAEIVARSDGLKGGDNVSCGCKKVDQLTVHGDTGTAEHSVWLSIFDRCRNPKDPSFKDYGARGIDICSRWEKYGNFLADVGRRPSNAHTLERVKNDEGYYPGNCCWATRRQQSYNRRSTKMTIKNADLIRARSSEPQINLAQEFGVSQSTISTIVNGKAWL